MIKGLNQCHSDIFLQKQLENAIFKDWCKSSSESGMIKGYISPILHKRNPNTLAFTPDYLCILATSGFRSGV